MTEHLHAAYVEGCFRCDLSRDESPGPDPNGGINLTDDEFAAFLAAAKDTEGDA